MNDLISILGYSKNSPFKGNPYLDIHTPDGLIDMSNTDMDLIGIDNKGNKKKMKAGRKNPYKFEGNVVREIPAGNPYQEGGMTREQVFSFLFDGDDDYQLSEKQKEIEEREKMVEKREKTYNEQLIDFAKQRRQLEEVGEYNEAMSIVYGLFNNEDVSSSRFPKMTNSYGAPMNGPIGSSAGKGVNPKVLATEKDIFSEFKGITNLGIWGDAKHRQRKSDHNTGDAQDFGIGNNIETGNKIAQKLISEAKERGIKYIIFDGKIWNPSISNEWRPYSGKNPHSTHVHVSYHR